MTLSRQGERTKCESSVAATSFGVTSLGAFFESVEFEARERPQMNILMSIVMIMGRRIEMRRIRTLPIVDGKK